MTTLNGLPTHVLLVHAVVILIPVAAVVLILTSLWPAAGRRLAVANAVLATAALVLVPVTTEAGDWLEHHVERSSLLSQHTELGDTLLPWVAAMWLVAAAGAARQTLTARSARRPVTGPGTISIKDTRRAPLGGPPLAIVLAALAVVAGVGAFADTILIGESGARAAWTGHFSEQPLWGNHHG